MEFLEVVTAYAQASCSPLGQMSSQSQPLLPAPPTTTYSYDSLGRTVSAKQAEGSTTQYV